MSKHITKIQYNNMSAQAPIASLNSLTKLNKLVVFCGRARSGKDTGANYLRAVWGYKVNHFAGALKRGCQEFFGFNDDQLYGETKMTTDDYWKLTPRLAFQLVGTELMRKRFPELVLEEMWRVRFPGLTMEEAIRAFPEMAPTNHIGENFWIKRITKDYVELGENERMCIADGRFPNESKFCKDNGGIRIRITRPGTAKMEHDSERFIDDLEVDYEICNDGTIEQLLDKIDAVLGLTGMDSTGYGSMSREAYIAQLKTSHALAAVPAPISEPVNEEKTDCETSTKPDTPPMILFIGDHAELNAACATMLAEQLEYTYLTGEFGVHFDIEKAYEQSPGRTFVATHDGDACRNQQYSKAILVIEVRLAGTRSAHSADRHIIATNAQNAGIGAFDLVEEMRD